LLHSTSLLDILMPHLILMSAYSVRGPFDHFKIFENKTSSNCLNIYEMFGYGIKIRLSGWWILDIGVREPH